MCTIVAYGHLPFISDLDFQLYNKIENIASRCFMAMTFSDTVVQDHDKFNDSRHTPSKDAPAGGL